jgi:predicted permease
VSKLIEQLGQDIRYAVRALARTPGFTAIAILTLALAIGVNTGMFSIVHAVLLRPLPYSAPDQLMRVREVDVQSGSGAGTSYPNFVDWQRQSTSFQSLAAYEPEAFNLTGIREPILLDGAVVSSAFFEVLGAKAQVGDTVMGARLGNTVVVSHRVYVRDFNSDSGLIGRQIRLDGEGYVVVGVASPQFDYPKDVDLWVASTSTRPDIRERVNSRSGAHGFNVIGRLNPGISLRQAEAEMHVIARRLESRYPEADRARDVRVAPLQQDSTARVRTSLLFLMASVGFVLLGASANLGNLILSRSMARQHEVAIRLALGAGRVRIILQMLMESFLLSLAGATVGVILCVLTTGSVVALAPADLPRIESVRVDATVLAFSAGLAVLAAILCGLAPAWNVSRRKLNPLLKESILPRAASNGLSSTLVVAEIALSLMLLMGAGLLMKSLFLLQSVPVGFQPDRLLTMQVYRPVADGSQSWSTFYQQVTQNIGELPGVESAGATLRLPTQGREWISLFAIEGLLGADPSSPLAADQRIVSNNYFEVMGIPLRRGRLFSSVDQGNSLHVAIINETMAMRYFPHDDPIGKVISTKGFSAGRTQIVGVVGSTHQSGPEQEPAPEVYYPNTQVSIPWQTIVVRAKSDPMTLLPAIRRTVSSIDAEQSVSHLATMDQLLNASKGQARFRTELLASFAVLDFALAILGIYGVVAHSVSGRTREIGIRMALGARKADVQMLVFKQALRLVLGGLALGSIGALGLARFLATMVYGTSVTDPIVFVAVLLILGLTALLATYVPARRAAGVNPLVALRFE